MHASRDLRRHISTSYGERVFALKGREADLVKLAPIVAPKIRVGN
jgi:hypothetical protein